ncbi:uncharacterized protein LOC121243852 [Juglans microcarpa x Juglans regia]|uniref:uncharacterized protein LOC121243852 n=1 Tax=Juglans microcarpa x Juglans regia TaxID=2249226 RepID=UPI001B7F7674|nr:uncharacterized protein LOC121243852 [Juglans microcarpa x Juglans regia]
MSTQPNQPAVSSLEMDAQPIERLIQPDQKSADIDLDSYFKYKPERDSANDVRNALLVVLALIAAATFQAGLNPPGGVWQDTKNDHGCCLSKRNTRRRCIFSSTCNVVYDVLFKEGVA